MAFHSKLVCNQNEFRNVLMFLLQPHSDVVSYTLEWSTAVMCQTTCRL